MLPTEVRAMVRGIVDRAKSYGITVEGESVDVVQLVLECIGRGVPIRAVFP